MKRARNQSEWLFEIVRHEDRIEGAASICIYITVYIDSRGCTHIQCNGFQDESSLYWGVGSLATKIMHVEACQLIFVYTAINSFNCLNNVVSSNTEFKNKKKNESKIILVKIQYFLFIFILYDNLSFEHVTCIIGFLLYNRYNVQCAHWCK